MDPLTLIAIIVEAMAEPIAQAINRAAVGHAADPQAIAAATLGRIKGRPDAEQLFAQPVPTQPNADASADDNAKPKKK